MNPHDPTANRSELSIPQQQRSLTPPRRDYTSSHTAAADVIRGQIQSIYSGNSDQNTPHTTPVATPQATTDVTTPSTPSTSFTPEPRRHIQPLQDTIQPRPQPAPHALKTTPTPSQPTDQPADTPGATTAPAEATDAQPAYQPRATADQWDQYHSAWQKYYQLYYERYYASHLHAKQQEFDAFMKQQAAAPDTARSTPVISDDPDATALKRLRSQIQQKVRSSAQKVTRSRHFRPAIAGLAVMLIFMAIQFNRPVLGFFASYTTPGNIDPQNIIVNPAADMTASEEPRMIIPKINVDAPVVYGVSPDHASQMKAMEKGIAHFAIAGASAVPGQAGNAVFAAHSSNDAFASGDYKFVFAQNEKLAKDDVIYMHYQGKRYTYAVTKTEVVMPNEVSKVQIQTDKPTLTLISCVPLGTAEKRLLIFAEQISPEPQTAAAPSTQATATSTSIPGKPSPTLIERLFGAQ